MFAAIVEQTVIYLNDEMRRQLQLPETVDQTLND